MAAQINPLESLVHVTGVGKIKAVPDGAIIKVRVESQGNEALAVKTENDRAMGVVITFLRTQEIDDKDVQTQYINLNKNYDYNKKIHTYIAYQTLTIKLSDITKYEHVMSGLLNAGINRIDGVQFTASTLQELKAKARVDAIHNAKEKAASYAQALGQSIGKAVYIRESESDNPQPPMYKSRMLSTPMNNGDGGETIAPGELTYISRVSVSFELH